MREDHERTDEELVDAAKNAAEGDVRAFEGLVVRHKERVVANCRYLTRSPADAEDLAQEVFLKAYFGLKRFEGRAAFRTWIQRIKVNHCLNHIKKRDGKTFVELEEVQGKEDEALNVEPSAERRAEAQDERRKIETVLGSMNDTLRVPLIMRDMDQMSYQEIADALSIGLSAVKMRIKRAREEFQESYRAIDSPTAATDTG